MSRRPSFLLVCLANLWLGCAIFGQTTAAAVTPQHIVTISFSTAVMQTAEAKHDFEALESKFAPRQRQLEALSHEVDDLRKQLNDQKDRLSQSELNLRAQTLAMKQKQLERAEEDYRNDSQSEGEEAFRRVEQKVFDFLQAYAHDHGYAMVIDRGTENTPVVLYATQTADITNEVVSAYNAKAGVPVPGANGSNGQAPGSASLNRPQRAPHRP